ncbi:MAG: phosphatase PAP2 family protein [Actinomycetota bacterium]
MKDPGSIRLSPGGFLVAAALVLFSMRFLDARIALGFDRLLRSMPLLSRGASRIPDLLLPVVLVLSGAMWAMYLRRVRRGSRDEKARFFLLSGTAMPAAFIAKAILKTLFGRMNTRVWLARGGEGGDLSFHWFHGGGDYGSFPSGHMAVFTALAAACWLLFPRYRVASLAAITGLGLALLATDYHYLSDVIAGGYLGLAVLVGTDRGLKLLGR